MVLGGGWLLKVYKYCGYKKSDRKISVGQVPFCNRATFALYSVSDRKFVTGITQLIQFDDEGRRRFVEDPSEQAILHSNVGGDLK